MGDIGTPLIYAVLGNQLGSGTLAVLNCFSNKICRRFSQKSPNQLFSYLRTIRYHIMKLAQIINN